MVTPASTGRIHGGSSQGALVMLTDTLGFKPHYDVDRGIAGMVSRYAVA